MKSGVHQKRLANGKWSQRVVPFPGMPVPAHRLQNPTAKNGSQLGDIHSRAPIASPQDARSAGADLEALAQMQRRLCGPREMRQERWEVAADIFPVAPISGDFFSLFKTPSGINVALGDIAGKGLPAGFWTAHLIGLSRQEAARGAAPSDAVMRINRALLLLAPEAPLAAYFFAQLDTRNGWIRYCNAGQPPALVLRADHRAEELNSGGPILGAMAEASYLTGEVQLRPGDYLIAFSDGVLERNDLRGREFGHTRLLEAARSLRGASARKMLYSLFGAVQDFAGSAALDGRRRDDFSMVVVRCHDRKIQ
jgi:sigma-B regulation protein RsbU (phosphoserine phosphatase)